MVKIKFLTLIIQCTYLCERKFSRHLIISAHFLLCRRFRRRKSVRITLEFIFLVSQKFVIYEILNTQKLFWFTIDSSVLLNEGGQFFFHDICDFFVCIADCIQLQKSLNISAHLSIKIILVDPDLLCTFFGNVLFLIMVRTLKNNYFLLRTKLGYLR